MTLIDDYLRAVALLLPKDKRDDIIEELRELILSRLESREAELGRTLTDDEVETVLREIGHPLVVASRYRDGPQHVVGPALYPYWMFAVKAAVTLQVAVGFLVFLVRMLIGEPGRAGGAISGAFTGSLILIGLATVAAWMIERQFLRVYAFQKWRVKDLRFLSVFAWDADALKTWWGAHTTPYVAPRPQATAAAAPPPPIFGAAGPYVESRRARRAERLGEARAHRDWRRSMRRSPVGHGLAGVAAGVVLLLWWVGVLHFGIAGSADDFRTLGLEPGSLSTFDWASLKAQLYLPVLAYVGLLVALGAVRIAHPDAIRMQGLLDIAIGALVVATVSWLWTLSPIASAVGVDTLAAFAHRMRDLFSDGPPFPMGPALTLLLAIVGFGGVIRAVRGFWEVVLPAPFAPTPYRTA